MKAIGVDLGTTNTVAAFVGSPFAIDGQDGTRLPSVVAFPPSRVEVVGLAAQRRRPIDPRNTIVSAKRLIGRKWLSADRTRFTENYPLTVIATDDKGVAFDTRMGPITPIQVGASLLRQVRSSATDQPDELGALITVPSMFTDEHRRATHDAGMLAGFAAVHTMDEPVAVAHAYARAAGPTSGLAAVYDFGGGTFDFAVVDCSGGSLRVLSHGGDLYLGGDDIDQRLANWAADEILRRDRWDMRSDRSVFARLVAECEQAKIRLCDDEATELDLARVDPAVPSHCRNLTLSRQEIEQHAEELFRQTFIICDQVLHQSRVKAADITAVYSAGGTSMLPNVQRGLEQYFEQSIHNEIDPMQVVAIGASLAAADTF